MAKTKLISELLSFSVLSLKNEQRFGRAEKFEIASFEQKEIKRGEKTTFTHYGLDIKLSKLLPQKSLSYFVYTSLEARKIAAVMLNTKQ